MIRIDAEVENNIVELARSGNRPAAISNSLDLPVHFVRKIIHKHGIKIIPQTKSDNIDLYKIIAMLMEGEKLIAIGSKFGVTRQYVFLIKEKCLQAGIKLPDNSESI